ncbi:MAG: copper-translocating P-type ATPase [Ignavibacteria bacterium]|nr:copper-translocating P-type ATPase [Ignavibacteria bacterium]
MKNEKLELDILGMNCINCADSISTYLSKTEGIISADLNFTSETASVEFNSKIINKEKIKSIIKKLGYDVLEDNEETESELVRKKQLKIMKIKIITAVLISLIVVTITMNKHFGFTFLDKIPYNINLIILFILSSIVIFWSGSKFISGAYNALKNKTSDMNTLITLGVFSSYFYSILLTLNHLFDLNIKVFENSHEVYYETATMIISFILTGNYLEAVLKSKTSSSIKKLKDLQSKNVTVIRNDNEIIIPYKKVKVNDIVIIKSGDKIPVDGRITEGNCLVDESAITGESTQTEKTTGENLISGTTLKNGFVKLLAEKVGSESTLSKIIKLVKDASNTKPKIQRFADKIASIFVPLVVFTAIFTFIIWFGILGEEISKSMLFSVSVLIIACPCALGLASPMAVVIGIGRAAENGILFNNIEAIEKMNKINTMCFDKTGTLTLGKMSIKQIVPLNGFEETNLLKYIYSIEKFSNHPIAKSIVEYCNSKNITESYTVNNLKNYDGLGICAEINFKIVLIGNRKFLSENKIATNLDSADKENNFLFIGIDNKVAGKIELEDSLKPEAKNTVKNLQSRGYEIFMISGDNRKITEKTAFNLDIKKYSFNTLPEDKQKIVSELQEKGKNVAMFGDGINDAPSLAQANVGVAMGNGTDIAIETADMILVKGDLKNIIKSVNISKRTVSVIKQNIFWAFFYNILAIPLAAGILAPAGIIIGPVMASMLMAFSDVITVIGNSLRLKYVRID